MSQSFNCHCPERKKPVKDRAWVVVQRQCNHSAFSGYAYTPSDWSCIWCKGCHALGRTKAKYVSLLKDGPVDPHTPPIHGYHAQINPQAHNFHP